MGVRGIEALGVRRLVGMRRLVGVGAGAVAGVLVLVGGVAGVVWAHDPNPPLPGEVWGRWTLDPVTLAGLGLASAAYGTGVRRLWARAGVGRGVRRWEAMVYFAGIVSLLVALVSPLDALGAALFSAHMLQHMILMIVAAPLLVLGRPLVAYVWALPPVWRRRVGGWARQRDLRATWRTLNHPVAAWTLHAVAVWVWHAPSLYQATLSSEFIHFLQHFSFTATALLFWWILVHRRRRGRMAYGIGVLYLFTTAIHSSILGALITFAPMPWYPVYTESARAWGLSPLEDQQLGGLVMWVPAGAIYVIAAVALFAVWLVIVDAEVRRRERRAAERRAARAAAGLVVLLAAGYGAGCGEPRGETIQVSGGDPALAPEAIRRYGCAACHTISGIRGANGRVGPSLTGIADQVYIAGMVENSPENMVRWIHDPRSINPLTVMPITGISEAEARHVAAYLYQGR